MSRDARSCLFSGLWFALLLTLLVGCRAEPDLEKTELLPEAGPNETNFSPYQPKNPYAQVSDNLLERQILEVAGPQGTTIKILDLYVPPTRTAQNVSLPGAAVLDVKNGEGKLVLMGNPMNLSFGTTGSVPQGTVFSVQNTGQSPLIIRARVIVAP